MRDLKEGSLEIKITADKTVQMTWLGRSDDRDPSSILNPYISEMIEGLDGRELEVEFSKLEYMNSSTISSIIVMLKHLNSTGIPTRIFYNKNSKWQSASFKALETIARTMKTIEVSGR